MNWEFYLWISVYIAIIIKLGAMELDPAKMSSIMIETIADYAKKSCPGYLRLVEVVIFHRCSEKMTVFREKMGKYANVSKCNHLIYLVNHIIEEHIYRNNR